MFPRGLLSVMAFVTLGDVDSHWLLVLCKVGSEEEPFHELLAHCVDEMRWYQHADAANEQQNAYARHK